MYQYSRWELKQLLNVLYHV